jgi:hypothetical protein
MPSNTDYYSALMLDKNGEYNQTFLSLLADSHESNTSPEALETRHSVQKMLKAVNENRVRQAKFILENTDSDIKNKVMDATEKRFANNLSINRNLQNIVGPNNVNK